MRIIVAVQVLMAAATGCEAQASSQIDPATALPTQIAEAFFTAQPFEQYSEVIAGEMDEHYGDAPPMSEYLPPGTFVRVRSLAHEQQRAIVAVTVSVEENTKDWYLYFTQRDGGWKLSEVRSLALPPFFAMLVDSLAAEPNLPDSLAWFRENLQLTMASDSALQARVREDIGQLEELAGLFATLDLATVTHDGQRSDLPRDSRASALLRDMRVTSARLDSSLNNCLVVTIGGVIDNAVGYLRETPECVVPRMTPTDWIYLEHVVDGWYVFKTT